VRSRDYLRAVDRIPYSAMLETREEIQEPRVHRYRFPLRTRWILVTSFKSWATWRHAWNNVVFLVRG
jgi:hypothetical protein